MNTIKLLLVDDEMEFTLGLSKILRRRGMDVAVAGDGESALKLLEANSFHVALLDVKMPGMDGIQLLREMRRITPSTQVILMTGHLSSVEEIEGMKTGAFAYLLKPHPIPDLIALIQKAAYEALPSQEKEDSGP